MVLELKSDTFAVESNVHFPTDINLLWDSARKCLSTIELIRNREKGAVSGWRKVQRWFRKTKKLYRSCSNIHRKKGKNYAARLEASARMYVGHTSKLLGKVTTTLQEFNTGADLVLEGLKLSLKYYRDYLEKFISLVDRRILKGEKIPHEDKVFSIFEPHVEWLSKGKEGRRVELGHNVLITTDQFHFIVDHEVVIKQKDSALVLPLLGRLEQSYGGSDYELKSISFDRGFYSGPAKKVLQSKIKEVVMPKPGKKSQQQTNEESQAPFENYRQRHSAVESNINELEHSGADKVRDKGIVGFTNYVAWSVVAYNLKRLGRIVLEQCLLPVQVTR